MVVYSPAKTRVWGPEGPFQAITLTVDHFLSPGTPWKWGLSWAKPLPLPRPGGSACGRSRLFARWEPAAVGHPCCLSVLWSAEQTSPSLEHVEDRRDRFNQVLKVLGHSYHELPCHKQTPTLHVLLHIRKSLGHPRNQDSLIKKAPRHAQICAVMHFSLVLSLDPNHSLVKQVQQVLALLYN